MRFLALIFFLFGTCVMAQKAQVTIETSEETLNLGEKFRIKVTIQGTPNFEVSEFPVIAGFVKSGRQVSHSMIKKEGKNVLQHTILQTYTAQLAGEYDLEATELTVNGEKYQIPTQEFQIIDPENPSNELVNEGLKPNAALLFLFVQKKEVYVGEGLGVHLAFYVSEQNTVSYQFSKDLEQQIANIASKFKSANVLESRLEINNIQSEPAKIGGKNYIRYKLFEAIYYPLTDKEIIFPSVSITLLTDGNKKDSVLTEQKTFKSQPFNVQAKPLPDHPLRNKVPVGIFSLSGNRIPKKESTGKIINYELTVKGEGNFASVLIDKPANDKLLEIFPPQISQEQKNGDASGEKSFLFKIFPKDSGSVEMRNYFHLIYFNVAKDKYDTLMPNQKVQLFGEKIEAYLNDGENIYENLETKFITDKSINWRKIIKNSVNILLFLMIVGMLFIFDFQKKN